MDIGHGFVPELAAKAAAAERAVRCAVRGEAVHPLVGCAARAAAQPAVPRALRQHALRRVHPRV